MLAGINQLSSTPIPTSFYKYGAPLSITFQIIWESHLPKHQIFIWKICMRFACAYNMSGYIYIYFQNLHFYFMNVMFYAICYQLYNLKNVKNTHGKALFSVKLLHECFSRFFKFTIDTKSRNASQIKKGKIFYLYRYKFPSQIQTFFFSWSVFKLAPDEVFPSPFKSIFL